MTETSQLLSAAHILGFELTGIIPVCSPSHFDAFERWIKKGMYGSMNSFVRLMDARKHPNRLLPEVQSILMLGVSYETVLSSSEHPVQQWTGLAEYARGTDYHRWIKYRLALLAEKHAQLFPSGRCRGTCDTAPILEKQYAADAGLGIIGKNTLLLHPQRGSKLFLAVFLSTEILVPSPPAKPFEPCNGCQRCLEACPTGALIEPFVLDMRRCLNNYLMYGWGEELPPDIAVKRGSRFFGCDTCQQVCPHNAILPKMPAGTVNPFDLDTKTLRREATGSPLEHFIGK